MLVNKNICRSNDQASTSGLGRMGKLVWLQRYLWNWQAVEVEALHCRRLLSWREGGSIENLHLCSLLTIITFINNLLTSNEK